MIVARDRDLSVVVTNFNRRDLLLKCLAALDGQTLRLEVIVADDGSTDGSVDAVREAWPEVKILANETGHPRGVSQQLKLAYQQASCRYLASFDEDFHLEDPEALADLMGYFDDPRVAVVAIPFRDVLIDDRLQQVAPDDRRLWQRYTFTGNGYVIDMEAYRAVGGYLTWNESYRQEEDLALRLLASGRIVRVVPPVHEGKHWRQPGRLSRVARLRSARNDILFYWLYAPLTKLLPYIVLTAVRNIKDGLREGGMAARLLGILSAPKHAVRHHLVRTPVSQDVFRRYRRLKRAGILPADDLQETACLEK